MAVKSSLELKLLLNLIRLSYCYEDVRLKIKLFVLFRFANEFHNVISGIPPLNHFYFLYRDYVKDGIRLSFLVIAIFSF